MDSITECSTTNQTMKFHLLNKQQPAIYKAPRKKLKKCSKKRKHELEILEAREKELNAEKMHRMDRFLYLLERSIKNKE